MTRIGGLVLAAGEGRRFGGPKQLAPVAGRPLLEHALAALAAVPALDPLVLVLGARAEEVRAGVDTAPFEVVVAHDWAEGSAASLRAGVAALGDVDAALVALGDQPFLPPASSRRSSTWRGPARTSCARPTTAPPAIPSCSGAGRSTASRTPAGTRARAACSAACASGRGSAAPSSTHRHRHPRATGEDHPMKLEQSFEVEAPIDVVWGALTDLERVTPCLPGATLVGQGDDNTYEGEFKVKLGPTTASYRGTVHFESLDEAGHSATMKANGTDKRGHGGASATIVSRLVELDGARTRVELDTDYAITGRLASFGRPGMIQDISNRLLGDFSVCLQEQLGRQAPTPAAPDASAAAAGEPGGTFAGGGPAPAAPMPASPPPAAKPFDAGSLLLSMVRNRLADLLEALARRLRT
jgi:carbon monoxide dehydrogenase subunit G